MPALATRLRFRAMLWWQARVLPLRVRRKPLEAVIGLAQAGAGERYDGLDVAYVIKRVRRTARRPWLMRDRRCLREGLLAFRFLSASGFAPELHFGIDRNSVGDDAGIKAHCWIVHRGETVLNPPDPSMVRILVHPRAA